MSESRVSVKLILFSIIHRLQEFIGLKRGKFYFEYLYSKKNDIWDYKTSEYELEKYQKSYEIISHKRYANALEIGCSIGVFTKLLCEIADQVTAIDISAIAINKAKLECKKNNVEFMVLDLLKIKTVQKYDLVCVAEVLYYLEIDEKNIKLVVDKINRVLNPGGYILYVCGSWEMDKHNDWENYFQNYSNSLKLIKTEKIAHQKNNYRISLIQKVNDSSL